MKQILAITAVFMFGVGLQAKDDRDSGIAANDVAAIFQLAINHGVPMYNGGDTMGCAAVYEVALTSVVRLQPDGFDTSRLEQGLAEGRATTDADARAWAYRRAMDDTFEKIADVNFQPLIEAELPVGFPAPGPVGEVVLKDYPAYRGAYTANNNGFWSLFNHIKRNDIAMTAPVAMDMDIGETADGEFAEFNMTSMAFLYRDPEMGEVGADPEDGGVTVTDWSTQTVLSYGMRGPISVAKIKMATAKLNEALEQHAGSVKLPDAGKTYRMLGYNSPMVPENRRFYEIQLIVEEDE